MVGEVVPATCELYDPLPYSTCTTWTLEMIGPPKEVRWAPAGAAKLRGRASRHGTPCWSGMATTCDGAPGFAALCRGTWPSTLPDCETCASKGRAAKIKQRHSINTARGDNRDILGSLLIRVNVLFAFRECLRPLRNSGGN